LLKIHVEYQELTVIQSCSSTHIVVTRDLKDSVKELVGGKQVEVGDTRHKDQELLGVAWELHLKQRQQNNQLQIIHCHPD